MTAFSLELDKLRWHKFFTNDEIGFVSLVDVMGDESAIVQAARVSYGEGTKSVSDDVTLIRYLLRHRHSTPFEMVELKFLIYLPIDVMRQHIRHRTASVNEYSTRYSEAIDEARMTNHDEWRSQSQTNKQGSGELVTEWPEGTTFKYNESEDHWEISIPDYPHVLIHDGPDKPESVGIYLSECEQMVLGATREIYEERIALGVAREQARKDLPLSTYTKAYWKINLHNLLHYLGLRMDSHAQKEIREYANHIGHIVSVLYPNVWKAFTDYRMNSLTFSAPEVEELYKLILGTSIGAYDYCGNKRESKEFLDKIKRIGFEVTDRG